MWLSGPFSLPACGHSQRISLSLDAATLQHNLCPNLLELYHWGPLGMVGPGTCPSIGEATMVPEAAEGASMAAPKARRQQKLVRKLRVGGGTSSHAAAAAGSTSGPYLEHLPQRPRLWLPTPAVHADVRTMPGSFHLSHAREEDCQT